MKKYILILVVGTMFGCSTTQTCVQVSPVAKRTVDGKHVYFLNDEIGIMIHRMWAKGVFGSETKSHLVDSVVFYQIPVTTSTSASVNRISNRNVITK